MIAKAILFMALLTSLPHPAMAAKPLPPRALARIGDRRFYHGPGIVCAVWSPDGRRIVSATFRSRNIVLWDAATGERLREMRVPQGTSYHLAFSPDGKRLAANYAIPEEKSGVVLFDLDSGKILRQWDDFQCEVGHLQFSSDGERLRVSEWGGPVSAWDVASGKKRRLWKPPPTRKPRANVEVYARQGFLSADDKAIVWEMVRFSGVGCPDVRVIGLRVHDAATDKLLYQKKFLYEDDDACVRDHLMPSIALSADGKRMVADNGKLTVWETVSGRERNALKLPKMVYFALAPDGRHAIIEEAAIFSERSQLRLWDLNTGKPLREIFPVFENWRSGTSRMSPVFSPDGKTLLFATETTLRLVDTKTGRESDMSTHRAPVTPRFSADGRTLFTSCEERKCRWDVSKANKPKLLTRERKKTWETERRGQSTDERFFVDCLRQLVSRDEFRLRETATGRVLRTLPEGVDLAAFSLDASRLLFYPRSCRGSAKCRLYEVKTGKVSGAIEMMMAQHEVRPVFSPKGRFVAWVDITGTAHLHDAKCGKAIRILQPSRPLPTGGNINPRFQVFFSPDDEQLIVSGCFPDRSADDSDKTIQLPLHVFRIADGRVLGCFYANPKEDFRANSLACAAWSPDGRLLAVAEKESGTIRLLEIASGKVRAEFAGHRHGVHGLAFSPDGQTLASGGEDNVVFLWDAMGAKMPAKEKTTQAESWNHLASEDAQRAGEAIAALLRAPGPSVAFLQEHLHPEEVPDEKHLARLLADLDSDSFEKRTVASRELARLGERAEAALRQALKHRPSLEARRRIGNLLDKRERGELPLETLRMVRAIEVLEHLGTLEARRVLEALAKGAAEARPTRDAKRALERLTKRR